MQDDCGIWQALPFEIAHGIVRTVVWHCDEYLKTKTELQSLKDSEVGKKSKIEKLEEKLIGLRSADRFIVYNKRTGGVATAEWLSKHIKADAAGKPMVKSESSRSKSSAWIMTLRFQFVSHDFNISLRTTDDSSFRRIRCFSLRDGIQRGGLFHLAEGYAHVLEDNSKDDAEDS